MHNVASVFVPGGGIGTEATVTSSEGGRLFFQRRFLLFTFLVAVLSVIFLPMMAGLEAAGSRPLGSWTVSALNPFVIAGTSLSWAVSAALLATIVAMNGSWSQQNRRYPSLPPPQPPAHTPRLHSAD